MPDLSVFTRHTYQLNEEAWKPILFALNTPSEQESFHTFLGQNKQIVVLDTIRGQIKELIRLRNPSVRFSAEELENRCSGYLANKHSDFIGNWCYFSWSNKIVHLLPEEEFIEVRTNRNKLKITADEQKQLSAKTIGVIGLSVGQSVAVTLVMERLCGHIKLADFDDLDLSNLNRLRTGVYNLGVKKVLIAAREIAEIDPYINVNIFDKGITDENLEDFFSNLDLLVEVCDGLEIKVKSRLKAREMGIPVVMDTNDRGMIDIERFDTEPSRQLFHGLVSEAELSGVASFSPQQRLDCIKKIVSFENTSERLKLSMEEIGKSISTWPQLASSVMIGAGSCADSCRRILLKQQIGSGRYYIDTLSLIN